MNTYGKKKINTGKTWQNLNNRGRRPVRLIPLLQRYCRIGPSEN
jgi:hypothetical protein